MSDANYSGGESYETNPDTRSDRLSSRRKLLAGVASFGAWTATGGLGASSAFAHRRRWRHRRRHHRSGGGGGHCFLKGTLIDTPEGERRIETLTIGDLVRTASERVCPVKWTGMWTANKDGELPWEPEHVPVKVIRGALDGVRPHRDLYVSNEHCLFVDGLLIPAIDLVNGVSIKKEMPLGIAVLEYFHIELDDHNVIFANGAAAETFRFGVVAPRSFDNYEDYLTLYGEPTAAPACAPIASNASRLDDIQSRLRSAVAPIYDMRQPLEIIRDRLADRAIRQAA